MIKIPAGLLSPEELVDATGIKARNIDIEFTEIKLEKKSLVLTVGIKLNFVMPLSLENLLKARIMEQNCQVSRVKCEYHFIANEAPKAEEPVQQKESSSWNRSNSKGRQKQPPRTGNALWGRDFNEEPITYAEALTLVGEKKMVVLEGEAFDIDTKPIKNDRTLFSMGIAGKGATFGIKAFLDNESNEHIAQNLKSGDIVQVKGFVEYDTWDHMNILSAKAIKKSDKISNIKKDTYPNGRRVELHIHSKFSDNDGFNDAAQIVKTAASWGQPAVAITDHGVVQGFPDAANCAKKLKKDGKEIKVIFGLEGYLFPDDDAIDENGVIDIKKHGTYHIIILAKNKEGLKNMYKLVSLSHIDYFYKKPRIPRSVLEAHREGLIIGSACEAGELYQAIRRGESDDRLLEIASYYDYLEIQPLGNNQFMINEGLVSGKQDLIDNNLKILSLADKLGKLCVATTDSHYPTPEDAIYRNIIMKGIGFKDTESDNLYMRTTDEMMEEFSYLGDRAEEIVVTNTNLIADMCEEFMPVPEGKYPPKIEGAEETLRNSCYEKAKSIYGDPLPQVIVDRLEAELVPIIREGYAVMYVAAKLLVEKSMSDGYLVGSRGSVGSSFAATMAGITEVNPLDPHYVCPECKHFEFTNDLSKYDCGFDMPEKDCPKCGTRMHKDGLAIPFATFLGFEGNKEPDIDLNFAGEYQPTAHKYVGTIFGEKNVYKAGTVATLQDKTAFGYVKHYFDDKGIEPTKYDIDYMVSGCMGVKRTTGQHPGGIIVVPDDHEIYEFCPVQKPANKRDVDVITTHFDYHKIDQNLLKLDILGHDAPQLLRHLQNLTGVEPMSIPFDDKDTLSIFTSLDALKITNPDYKFTHGTYAIPEFGTNFTRGMLDDIKPTTVSALIKMSGFSHGTLVWQGNGQDLIRNGTATIDELISSRDDIMRYLILKGIENGKAFKIMEKVRKNKELSEDELELMKSHGVPDWYIWSCRTLTYLFPRAHASAYVMMSIRMAWFKINYPQAFYAAYFSSKIDDFDAEVVFSGYDGVYRKIEEISALGNSASAKQKTSLIVYEVMYEMLSRGYEFAEPELGVSDATNFLVVDGKVKMPFMAIEGIGRTAAESLGDAYEEGEFFSLDDVKKRTKLSGNNIESLKKHGLFKGLPDTAQVSIFDLF
ncbi:MAG: PolC-type DNA polymerase III [Clostridiales bacterium]|nr:PolC-type DNA polymerase III [Candidatus Crickella merdequi]